MNNDNDDNDNNNSVVQIKDSPRINHHDGHDRDRHFYRPPFICIAVISILIYLIFMLTYIFAKAGLKFTFDFCGKVDVGGLIDNDCTVIAQPGNGTPDDPYAFAKATDHWPFVHAVMPWFIVMKYTSVIVSLLILGIDLVGPIRTWTPKHLVERNNNSDTFKRKWVYTIKKRNSSFEKNGKNLEELFIGNGLRVIFVLYFVYFLLLFLLVL